jgi:uncharacterized Zn-binding protein involved in type VI secretion
MAGPPNGGDGGNGGGVPGEQPLATITDIPSGGGYILSGSPDVRVNGSAVVRGGDPAFCFADNQATTVDSDTCSRKILTNGKPTALCNVTQLLCSGRHTILGDHDVKGVLG